MRPTRARTCVGPRRLRFAVRPRCLSLPPVTCCPAGLVLSSRVRAAGPAVLSARSCRSAARRSSISRARRSPAPRYASTLTASSTAARRFFAMRSVSRDLFVTRM